MEPVFPGQPVAEIQRDRTGEMSSCMQPPLQSTFDLTYLTLTNDDSQIDLFESCH